MVKLGAHQSSAIPLQGVKGPKSSKPLEISRQMEKGDLGIEFRPFVLPIAHVRLRWWLRRAGSCEVVLHGGSF
jgi:hypothetical protein